MLIVCKTGLPHGLSKRHNKISARAHMQQCHGGQQLRASKGFFGRLYSHATAIARKSDTQRMDERRRQLGADCGQDIHHHIAERHRSSGETGVQSKVLPLAQPKQAFISPTRAKVSRWLDHDGETRRSTKDIFCPKRWSMLSVEAFG